MKNKSSIKQLVSWMVANNYPIDQYLQSVIDQAVENHKGEILFAHAHNRCLQEQTYECSIKAFENAEEYYNKTFKQ